jgi:oxygen-independent coproporphyrinogen-3 oxidase
VSPHRIHPVSDPVGLYVHVPFCQAKCRYCGFYSEPIGLHDPQRLVHALLAELETYRSVEGVATAYIGGGSPSVLPPDLLMDLAAGLSRTWPDLKEFTVECNPGQVRPELLDRLRKAGVNRLSIGAQSFHDDELAMLGRCHTAGQVGKAVRQAQAAGFDNVGLDLIFAIPGSTLASWRACLEAALSLEVQHVSAYALSFEPGTPMDQAHRLGRIQAVDEQTDRLMYEMTLQVLQDAGFEQYEVSNFAKPHRACRHNTGYWLNQPYIGIGPAAASCWQGRRTTNVASIGQYVAAIEGGREPTAEVTACTEQDRVFETAVLNLRMREGINLDRFKRLTGRSALEVFAGPIRHYEHLGLLQADATGIRLTTEALPIADSVLCDFAA